MSFFFCVVNLFTINLFLIIMILDYRKNLIGEYNMNDKLINIHDVSLLKVTRVRDWSICFSYDGQGYLIHGKYECGEGYWQDLYKRDVDKKGKYTLELIMSKSGNEYVKQDYFGSSIKHGNLVYSHIDTESFAYLLTKNGFASGVYTKFVESARFKLSALNQKLHDLDQQARLVREEIQLLNNKKSL